MTDTIFKWSLIAIASSFTVVFCILVVPAFLDKPDIVAAFAGTLCSGRMVSNVYWAYSTRLFCLYIYYQFKHARLVTI